MAEGVFDCADLVEIQVKADMIWSDNASNKEYVSRSEALQVLLAEQTADLTVLEDSDKDRDVKIMWVDYCASTVEDCAGDECTVDGNEPEATCKTYALDQCIETSFKVSENRFRTSNLSREEVVAKAMLKAQKDLEEEIARRMIASVDTFVGENESTNQPGVVAGTDTYIDGSYWTADIFGYLSEAGVLNKFTDPFILDGNNLYRQAWMSKYQGLNANEGSKPALFGSIRTYHDLFNMNQVLGANKMFMIDKGAIAFASKVRYSATPVTYGNGANLTRYSIPSKNVAGLSFDVVYKTSCSGDDITHHWKLIARFGTFLNPNSACNSTNTGVLSFTCGTQP
ncbi:MAG: hypothetical protein KC589_09245 [Nanoarchaeota archaeon]|nr:hypothetical protein [Nanoarchaeota archaeon]